MKLKALIVLMAMALAVFSSPAFADDPAITPMFSFKDLGIGPKTSADEIAKKAVALSELATALQSLNEQRLEEVQLRMKAAKAAEAEAKAEVKAAQVANQAETALIKEQNKLLKAQIKKLELMLKLAILEAEK